MDERDFFTITELRTKVIITKPRESDEEGNTEVLLERTKHTQIVRSTENRLKSLLFSPYYIDEGTGRFENVRGSDYYIEIEKDETIQREYPHPFLLSYERMGLMEEFECPVCTEKTKYKEDVYTTKCEHKLCVDCYKKIVNKNSCPLCRGKLWG